MDAAKPEPPPKPFESPLTDAAVNTLANLLFAGVPALSGNITASDAGRVLGALVLLMARDRERTREKGRMEEAEIGGYEYVATATPREDGVLPASDIVFDLMTSTEMRLAFAVLLGILQAVQSVALDGLPFGALSGFASGPGGQAFRLLWYLRAKAEGKPDPDRADRMRELTPYLRVWANTLPAHERSQWTSKTGLQIKRSLPAIEAQGQRIWHSWASYLAKLGYRIENFAPAELWDLPIYEPFDARITYKFPAATPHPVPLAAMVPGPRK